MFISSYQRKIYGEAKVLDYFSDVNGFRYSLEVSNAFYEQPDVVEILPNFVVTHSQAFDTIADMMSMMSSSGFQRLSKAFESGEKNLMFEKHEGTPAVLLSLDGQPTLVPLPMTEFFP